MALAVHVVAAALAAACPSYPSVPPATTQRITVNGTRLQTTSARMYGNDPNPGVHFGYTLLRCGDWWVEDPRSPAYNTFRRVGCGVKPPFKVTTPDMSKSRRAYAYLAVIGFNTGPVVPGRGSGIFLHVQVHNSTNGCVSLPRPQLLRVLRWLTPTAAPRIVIGLGL